ncbi:hypothetical protein ACQEVB_12765 [Pseudonocardia sp. CA-107938]|uniref:hypothetical protein n=1 Tax=Pseudonocardia sp. CA-107938 TaxID=3240021 RepID=UPI003D91E13A
MVPADQDRAQARDDHALALVTTILTALGTRSMTGGVRATAGLLVGGAVTDAFGTRLIFMQSPGGDQRSVGPRQAAQHRGQGEHAARPAAAVVHCENPWAENRRRWS